jgi:hypothetical protein
MLQVAGMDGVHASYSLPVYRQPVLRAKNLGLATPPVASGVYLQLPNNYRQVAWPVTDRACEAEALWIRQNMPLGTRQDMDNIVAALVKMRRYSDELVE